ncbi:MAG: YncE family protein, partial [Candidatus Latescibacteria bacterium]|nr:YncE family protein [Candidatus Latescibacterota bacterium]
MANKNDETVSVIQTSDNTVVGTIAVGEGPFGMAFTPDGQYVYEAVRGDNKVVVIETASMDVIASITGFDEPKDVAITPDGQYAYVVSHYGPVYVIDTGSNTLAETIAGATGGHTIKIMRDGSRAYFSEASYDYPNSVRVIDLSTNTLGAPIGVFEGSEGFDFTPDEQYIYVMDRWANRIQKISTETNTVIHIFTDGLIYDGYGVAISPDGMYGYATVPWISGNYGIHIFDVSTDAFIAHIETGSRIRGIETYKGAAIPWLFTDPTSGTIPAGSSMDIEVTFDATGRSGGDYDANILIASNDPDESDVAVPAHLHVTGAPDIAVSPDTLSFGEEFVLAGHREVVVRNEGTDSLMVSSVSSDTSVFVPDTTSFALSPRSSLVVGVSFAPEEIGAVEGMLSFVSNDPDEGTVTVALRGTGIYPPDITVSPDSLTDTLYTGASSTHPLTIGNAGLGELTFEIGEAYGEAGVSSEQVGEIVRMESPRDLSRKGIGEVNTGAPVIQGSGGPDGFGHRWMDSDEPGGPTYDWMEISGSGTDCGIHGDDDAAVVDVGFDFSFYGNTYSQVMIGENGFISFYDYEYSEYDNEPIPDSEEPNNMIAAFWDDHYTPEGGTIYYQTLGTAPHRRFVV